MVFIENMNMPRCCGECPFKGKAHLCNVTLDFILSDLENKQRMESCPLRDIDEKNVKVKVGHWNPGDEYCPVCHESKFKGLDADVWADWQPDYCPNCGNLMKEGNASGKDDKG